jgi:hypothetical protein
MEIKRASEIDELVMEAGSKVYLESLRQAVVPEYLMIMPFIIVPEGVTVAQQLPLDEDGVHGCIYELRADEPLEGELVTGFRDLRTEEIVREKRAHLRVVESADG